MKTIKALGIVLLLPLSALFGSCFSRDEISMCNGHLEWLTENKTSKVIMIEYVHNHKHYYSSYELEKAYGCVRQEVYDTFIAVSGSEVEHEKLHAQFLVEGEKEMSLYICDTDCFATPCVNGCSSRPLDRGCSHWYACVYNLSDTTQYSFANRYNDGYLGLEPFTLLKWEYDPENDTNYCYCYLTIDSSALAVMKKDYKMLDKFADYYSQQR